MNPITHFLASWTLADNVVDERRDRNLITWAGVLPDLDGLGALADMGQALLGRETGWHYGDYHHQLLHGLPGAVVLPAILAMGGVRRLRVFAFGFVAVHLHLLCDLVGSRGPEPSDVWPIWYLAPLSDKPELVWLRQWPLNAWPNIAFTLILLAYVLWAGVVRGHSVVSVFSARADPGWSARCARDGRQCVGKPEAWFNVFGTGLFGAANRCRRLLFPVIRIGTYRVSYTGPRAYVGRRLKG